MKKQQDEYIYLTVYSEPLVYGLKDYDSDEPTEYVKIEITTGSPSYPEEIQFCIKDDDDKHIMTFNITETTARYIQNYLKTYLEIINH